MKTPGNKDIFIDVDDVLNSFTENMLLILNKKYNKHYHISDVIHYSFLKLYNLSTASFHKEIIASKILETIEPVKEAKSFLKKLKHHDWFITLISARSYVGDDLKTALALEKWCKKHSLCVDKIIICKREDKIKYIRKYKPQYFIEDNGETIEEVNNKLNIYTILVNKPWNEKYTSNYRVHNLSEIPRSIIWSL